MTKGKLLLVEDDKTLAELLIWHFEREEFDVRRTADGEEALLLAEESPPDIVILDWMIGDIGLEGCAGCAQAAPRKRPINHLTERGRTTGSRPRDRRDDYVTSVQPGELTPAFTPCCAGQACPRWEQLSYATSRGRRQHKVSARQTVGIAQQNTPAPPLIEHRGESSAQRLLSAVWSARYEIESRTVDVTLPAAQGPERRRPGGLIRTVSAPQLCPDSPTRAEGRRADLIPGKRCTKVNISIRVAIASPFAGGSRKCE